MIDMATGMNDQVLSLSKHYKYSFYISLMLVVLIIVFNWWLIPLYDVYGAAWGTTIALIIYNLIKLFLVQSKMQLSPFSSKSPLIVLIAVIGFLVGYFLPRLNNAFADATYRSIAILVVYGSLLVLLKPSEDLNSYFQSVRKNKRLF
jgi:O-antigen/teichoic acid export membrane protein